MYAFVDVQDYQKVTVTDAALGINAAANAYMGKNGSDYDPGSQTLKNVTFTVESVQSAVIDGTTYYYVVDTQGKKYRACITVDELRLPFINVADSIKASIVEGDVSLIVEIK